MRILLTNDDGIDAPGIRALHAAVRDMGEVHVVAPAQVQSAMGHAVTFHKAMRCVDWRCPEGSGYCGYAVDGRPADCVKVALTEIIREPVDLVLSGMNAGTNIGINVLYSGTVAAAIEAAFLGLPAIAVSLHIGDPRKTRWDAAAAHARKAIDRILAGPMRAHSVVNLNIPILDDGAEPRGIRVAPISTSPLADAYHASDHPDGGRQYHARTGLNFRRDQAGSDVEAVFGKYITITPLHFDLTDHGRLDAWRGHFSGEEVWTGSAG